MNILAFAKLRGEIPNVVDLFKVDDQEQIRPIKSYIHCQPGDMAEQLKGLWTNGVRGSVVLICPDCEVVLRYDLLDEGIREHGYTIEEVEYEPHDNSTESILDSGTSNNGGNAWSQETNTQAQ